MVGPVYEFAVEPLSMSVPPPISVRPEPTLLSLIAPKSASFAGFDADRGARCEGDIASEGVEAAIADDRTVSECSRAADRNGRTMLTPPLRSSSAPEVIVTPGEFPNARLSDVETMPELIRVARRNRYCSRRGRRLPCPS